MSRLLQMRDADRALSLGWVDKQTGLTGRLAMAGCPGPVTTFEPLLNKTTPIANTNACHRGVAADHDGSVWVASNEPCGDDVDLHASRVRRVDLRIGLVIDLGDGDHYTHSDMTAAGERC